VLADVVKQIAISDLIVVAAAACVLYGLAMLHPAAPWIGGGVALAFVAIEVSKKEARKRQE
jgi:hypothetical protein